jgi:hypothetical protein
MFLLYLYKYSFYINIIFIAFSLSDATLAEP